MPSAKEILELIKLLEDLEPVGFGLVRSLIDKLKGATPDQIAQLAHAMNATAITEIDAELGTGAAAPIPPAIGS